MKIVLTCPECGDTNWIEKDDGFECAACGEFAHPEDMTAEVIKKPEELGNF